MTLDSTASAAAVAADVRSDDKSWPAAAGPEEEDLHALATLLAGQSTVTSEEQATGDLAVTSLESPVPTPAIEDTPVVVATAENEHDTPEAAEPPAALAEDDTVPSAFALHPPADWPGTDTGGDDDQEAAPDSGRPHVIALPDRTGETDAASQPHLGDALLQDIANAPSVSSNCDRVRGDTAWLEERGALVRKAVDLLSESVTDATTVPSEEAVTSVIDDEPSEGSEEESGDVAAATASAPDDTRAEDIAEATSGLAGETEASVGASNSPKRDDTPATTADLDEALLRGISAAPAVTSDQFALPTPASVSSEDDAEPTQIEGALPAPIDNDPADTQQESAFDETVLGDNEDVAATSEAIDVPAKAVYDDLPLGAVPPGPAAALAFATDPETELALRDGLFGYESAAPGCGEAQVWQGGLRAAIPALSEGHSAQLIFVDVDGMPFPAGAIHELATVCEVGTIVVAIGSDDTAGPGRELLLAGVTEYLAKPLSAEMVRAVAARAAPDAVDGRPGGCVAGFIGSGGSGTTTLMTAAALQAAARGCYVSVLDLNRSIAAAALALGVEPAAGLDQLLEAAGRATPEPDMVDGVRARRSDRIELYAYRWRPAPPAAPTLEAVDSLLAELRLRSHLVLVDGIDVPGLCMLPLTEVDRQVFVAEPIAGKAVHAARMIELLGAGPPTLFVQNHTRAFKRGVGARVLQEAGLKIEPDVVIPFERSLPEMVDWGWPRAKLPRSLRKPVEALTDRLLEPSPVVGAAASIHAPGGS